ncbi:uncharacterized protein LOC108113906 [Drosophila eugracilis]|uniref:uncharacterized protein LOC108113906 n=1 Tax=Drosophila eugracilis TaxID=29029 RepID=UPI0007E63D2F|nr:uncharacterized protein LOC108113906 [Drosophila eugracilis]
MTYLLPQVWAIFVLWFGLGLFRAVASRHSEHSTFLRRSRRFSLFGDFTACERVAAYDLRSLTQYYSDFQRANGADTQRSAYIHIHIQEFHSARRSWFCIVIRAAYLVISGRTK